MRTALFLTILVWTSISAIAQITIGMADMPQQGNILGYATTTITAFDTADTGPNHTWNFGQLIANGNDADTAVAVSSTPFLYQFYFNNGFLYPNHQADLAFRGPNFGAAQFSVSDVFEYFKVDPDGYRNVGLGANINGIPSSVRRIPVDRVLALPLNYLDTDASFSAFEFQVPSLIYFQEDQWRTTVVDGWGTLNLPSGQFDVLRVKSTLERIDTIYLDLAGFGFRTPLPTTVEYKWYTQGEKRPVLQVTTVGGVAGQVEFKDGVVGVNEAVGSTGPMPQIWMSGTLLNLELPIEGEHGPSFEVIDLEGRLAKRLALGDTGGKCSYDLSDLASGSYLIHVWWNGSDHVKKIILP